MTPGSKDVLVVGFSVAASLTFVHRCDQAFDYSGKSSVRKQVAWQHRRRQFGIPNSTAARHEIDLSPLPCARLAGAILRLVGRFSIFGAIGRTSRLLSSVCACTTSH